MARILIVNNAEPGITKFAIPIEKIIEKSGSTSVSIEYADCLDFNFYAFDGIILTGSPQGDDIIEHHLPYFLWIKNFGKPVLGICAGHHITGFMYGSKILRSEEPESGDFLVELVKSDPLFNGMSNTFKVKQMHNDSITLPEDFELLATSKTCRNQLMKHRTKPLYTCQFHPEYYNHKLIRNFVALCW
jgi:GMP synthase (glutamine-hydrolysing)